MRRVTKVSVWRMNPWLIWLCKALCCQRNAASVVQTDKWRCSTAMPETDWMNFWIQLNVMNSFPYSCRALEWKGPVSNPGWPPETCLFAVCMFPPTVKMCTLDDLQKNCFLLRICWPFHLLEVNQGAPHLLLIALGNSLQQSATLNRRNQSYKVYAAYYSSTLKQRHIQFMHPLFLHTLAEWNSRE